MLLDSLFFKWANPGLFSSFPDETIQIYLIKAKMEWLGLEPGAARWKAQTNLLSNGGVPTVLAPCTN